MHSHRQGRLSALGADLVAYLDEHRRLPRLGDNRPPWTYRGWLLAYVIPLHEQVPAVADRWGYYLRTLAAGRLLDEPIPPIVFAAPNRQVFALIPQWCRLIGRDCGGWSDFRFGAEARGSPINLSLRPFPHRKHTATANHPKTNQRIR